MLCHVYGYGVLEELAVSIFRVEVKDKTIKSSTIYNYLPDIYAFLLRVEVKVKHHISPKYL